MKRISLIDAYKIATMYNDISELSEDDLTEYIDALQYLIDNVELDGLVEVAEYEEH